MRRTTILNAVQVKRTTFTEAENAFYKHCRVKNLRPRTITYYKEDLTYFHGKTGVRYVDEITQEVFDDFIFNELEAGKKTSSLNTRIRGLRVFFSFCAEREYMKPIHPKLMKVDIVSPAVASSRREANCSFTTLSPCSYSRKICSAPACFNSRT